MPYTIRIMNRDHVLYEGEAESITSVNDAGEFDVLAEHANFIALIRDKLIIRESAGPTQEFSLKYGIMQIHDDDIKIFLSTTSAFQEEEAELASAAKS